MVSALAIHNPDSIETIQRVWRDIFALLPTRGCLLNLDLLFPEGPELAALYRLGATRDSPWDVHVYAAGLESQLRWL